MFATTNVFAESQEPLIWQDYTQSSQSQIQSFSDQLSAKNVLKKHSLLLDEVSLKNRLNNQENLSLKYAKGNEMSSASAAVIDLPLPNGSFVKVKAFHSPVLSDELAEKYPEIKTWRVVGADDVAITGRIDFTSKGFHGMLVMPDGDTIYIDPEANTAANVYSSLSKRENSDHFHTEFNCQVHDAHAVHNILASEKQSKKILANSPALDLKTYRFAVAGTAEYTASQGGTTAAAYASMVTTINRVNQIYQRDLGIRLELVSGEQLIYTNAATDPYTNNNANAIVSENMENMSSTLGLSNFDLGHVFAQGPLGGLAFVGVACVDSANTSSGLINGIKAGGATGTYNPQGEIFSIEYVAHEVGHQLGATHTFNSSQNGCGGGNRTGETAVEPGSGSTIMSYSGLCGSDDLQYNSDAYFHFASISQINSYTRSDYGGNCGTDSSSGSQNPSANAGFDIYIPANTPFLLDGSSTGGSSYTWDQTDTGSASSVDVDMGNNAIIRSLLPGSEPDRYIPSLGDLFAGSNTTGEKLPETTRELNFTFVVRDGNGGIGTDDKTINVTDTHSTFSVVSQSSNETLSTGQSINVIWNTAGTNVAPINCAAVDIQLIRSNGDKDMLLAATDNDGNQQLTIPGATPTMSGARMMVSCSDNSFFNISTGTITMQQGVGDLAPPIITLQGVNPVSIPQGSVYTDAGATAVDDIDGAVVVTTSGTVNTAVAGTYTITYSAVDAAGNSSTKTRQVVVTVVTPVDTTAPVITLNGSSTVTLVVGSNYVDAGATATDDVDGTVTVNTSETVNTHQVGSYKITYTAQDAAGNSSVKVRIVIVVAAPSSVPDTVDPVIELVGEESITINVGDSFTDPGFSAFDNRDGVVSVTVTGMDEIDTSTAGEYVITYTAIDAAGNIIVEHRTVVVEAVESRNDQTANASSGGGGSFGFLLIPLLALVRMRRFKK